MEINAVSSKEMQLIDKEAIESYHIPSIILMENAGKAVYEEAKKMLEGKPTKRALVLCGKGNNGGDGLVASRYMANDGIDVAVHILCERTRLKKDPLINFNILREMGVGISCLRDNIQDISGYTLIIDAIFGTGFKGNPDRFTNKLIDSINQSGIPVLAVDVPSGLDATTGVCHGISIKASKTITFGLPKTGFYKTDGPKVTGEIVVRNIGFPETLLKSKHNRKGRKNGSK